MTILDTRDLIERFEELETINDTLDVPPVNLSESEEIELQELTELLEELKGNGGDEQWRGDWYPITLIPDDEFTDYARELCADCGEIPSELPWYIEQHIDWDGVASELKCDYSTVEYDGQTYYYR